MTTARGGSQLSPAGRDRMRARVTPFAAALGRLGLTPNVLTVLGFLISCAAAVLAGTQLWLAAAIVGVGGAAFDMLDGALARAQARATRFGSFLDSTLDRWGEAVVYAGIAYGAATAGHDATVLLAALAMGAAFMVSYARAKAESLGFHGEVGIAPRPERVAILGAGLAASGLGGGPAGSPWLQVSLGLLFALSAITTIQRIRHVRAQASASHADPTLEQEGQDQR